MRAAWTVDTISTSQQPTFHQQYYRPNHVISPKAPDEYVSNEFSVKRVFWPQSFNSKNDAIKRPLHVNRMMKFLLVLRLYSKYVLYYSCLEFLNHNTQSHQIIYRTQRCLNKQKLRIFRRTLVHLLTTLSILHNIRYYNL